MICTHAPSDGTFSLRIPGLHVGRHSHIDTDAVKTFCLPSVPIVALLHGGAALQRGAGLQRAQAVQPAPVAGDDALLPL